MDVQKDQRLAMRRVESAIRLYGPDNVTSIMDYDTYRKKLDQISTKLGVFIEKSQEVIDELEELRHKGAETEQEVSRRVEEISSVTEVIIKRKNDNEINVKKKMEDVMKECNISKNVMLTNPTLRVDGNKGKKDQNNFPSIKPACSKLSARIADYCEIGPFLSHRPQFIATANYVIKQYQQKLPTVG